MSKKKKVLLFVIISIVLAVGIGFAYSFLKKKNRESKTVNVYAVSEVGYYGGYHYENMLYGNVTSTNEQKIYINSNQKISEIKVKEGDQVKVGDVLLVYDTTAQGLQLNTLATEVELARVAVLVAERELEDLKEITPVEETTEAPITQEPTTESTTTEAPTTEAPTTQEPTTENSTTQAPNTQTPGTENTTTQTPNTDEPGHEVPGITPGATPLDATDTDADDSNSSNPPAGQKPDSDKPDTQEPSTEAPSTQEPSTEEPSTQEPNTEAPGTETSDGNRPDEDISESGDSKEEITYTEKELKQAIKDKEAEIRRLNIAYQMIQVSYQIMEAQNATGELVCTCNGVVRTVIDEETAIANNEPLIVVGEADGYIVNTQIGELSLGKVNIGDSVSMMCYDDSMTYEGIVTSISEIPYDENYYGEPSESYYPMTVAVMNADNLYAGMYMEISLSNSGVDSEQDSLYLSAAFVKYENGGYYVYKEVDGILERCQVAVGTVSYGDIEIVGGLTYDDYIAFPYSADTVEGVKTKQVGGQAVLGRQPLDSTPWLTERHGYDPT